jgi:hypothetical protein
MARYSPESLGLSWRSACSSLLASTLVVELTDGRIHQGRATRRHEKLRRTAARGREQP